MTKQRNFYTSKYFHLAVCAVLLALSAIILLSFGRSENHSGHDIRYHLNVIRSLSAAWDKGSFFSKITELIGGDYGYGTGLFYSTVPAGVCVVLMKLCNLPIVWALYVEFLFLFALSGIVTYFFLRRAFKSNVISTIGSIAYICYPYFWWNLYVRFAFTEIFLMLAMPLIVWGVYELLYKQNIRLFFPLFTLGFSLSILSHLTMTVYIAIFLAVWLCIDCKRVLANKSWLWLAVASLIVLLITASFYLPMFINYGETVADEMSKTPAQMEVNTKKYFTERILMLDYAFTCGIGFLYAVWYAFFARKKRTAGRTALLVASCLIAFMFTHFFPWGIMPNFLRMIQYTFRLLLLGGVVCALEICILIKEAFIGLAEQQEREYVIRLPKKPSAKQFCKLCFTAFLCVGFLAYGSVASLHNKDMLNAYQNTGLQTQVAVDEITGRSEFYGLGAGKHGDYFPENCKWSYVSTRLKKSLITQTNMTISEVGNYDALSQVSFIAQKTGEKGYAILNIPYEAFAGVEVYRFRTASSNKQLEITATSYDNGKKVRLETVKDGNESKITLSYKNAPAFKAYLQDKAFGVLTLQGEALASNLQRTRVGEYALDVSVGKEGGILELPSYYYKGYKIILTTEDGKQTKLTANHGENGFVTVEIKQSGRLSVRFEAEYINWANALCVMGWAAFIGITVWLLLPETKRAALQGVFKRKKNRQE